MADSSANLPELKWVDGVASVHPVAPAATPEAFKDKKPKSRGPLAAIGSAVLLLLSKLKFLLISLKALSFGKLAFTSLSMLASIWFYAKMGGWLFGVGLVLLIFVHEMGHAVAIKRVGLKASWPIFIPFFGALINLKQQPRTAEEEAVIAYGGPFVGTLASVALAGVYFATGSMVALSLANTGFFLNLFNMLPIRPFDGGRIAQAFSKRAWILGLILLVGMVVLNPAPQLIVIAFFALTQAFSRRQQAATALSVEAQTKWAVKYFSLVLFLGGAMYFAKQILGSAPTI